MADLINDAVAQPVALDQLQRAAAEAPASAACFPDDGQDPDPDPKYGDPLRLRRSFRPPLLMYRGGAPAVAGQQHRSADRRRNPSISSPREACASELRAPPFWPFGFGSDGKSAD
jgi:hypothetical protein